MARARRKSQRIRRATGPAPAEELINPFAAAHGRYEDEKIVDLSGELGGRRMSIVNVKINRGGSAIDRWIATDPAGLFGEPQRRAITLVQALWRQADRGVVAIDPTRIVVDSGLPESWSQQQALDRLNYYSKRIPAPYWSVFENVCRFDDEAGVAGSRLATNSRSAIDAARTEVAFVASLIAMWERL